MAGVLQRRIAAKRTQERLLEGVIRLAAPEQPNEVPEDLIAVLLVEALEGRENHGFHHAF